MTNPTPELPENVGDYTGPESVALATMHLVREQLTMNRLLVALIDQIGEIALMLPIPGYPKDPTIRIRDYLPESDWQRIEAVSND